MNAVIKACRTTLVALHNDERGDNENLGRMLVLALILIPLVILLATFGGSIYEQAECQFNNIIGADVTTGSVETEECGEG
jgi:hypothetical protein